jgi:site-specific DNA-methyltransferase (cytosine-N4-specific)
MKKLLEDPESYYKPKNRPSGHKISSSFGNNRGGSTPPNLLEIANTASNTHYLRTCKLLDRKRHPARFPIALPQFFIEFLTEPGDLVMDIFSGSNTTGQVAEQLGRNWISIEQRRDYACLSAIRFMEDWSIDSISKVINALDSGTFLNITDIESVDKQLKLF